MQLPEFLAEQSTGSIRLVEHRIGLEHVIYFYNQGYTPEMVWGQFPTLSLALIHKLIAFYLENQAQVDAYVARCQEEVARQRTAAGSPDMSELRRRISQLSNALG